MKDPLVRNRRYAEYYGGFFVAHQLDLCSSNSDKPPLPRIEELIDKFMSEDHSGSFNDTLRVAKRDAMIDAERTYRSLSLAVNKAMSGKI